MLKAIIAGLACALAIGSGALAQTCPAYTYTLANGTTADASQVMANFNTVRNCVATGVVLRDYIAGLTLSTAGSSATYGVAAGQATNSTNLSSMNLASGYAKTTAAWAVGNAAGSLDTGAIAANSWYHVFLIQRPDTGVVDVLISLSVTAPTLPASYTLFRRVGSMKTNASSLWAKFSQNGDEFIWDVPTGDVYAGTPGTTSTLYTLTVPPGVKVNAIFNAVQVNSVTDQNILFSSPDVAIAMANSPVGNQSMSVTASGAAQAGQFNIRTNAAGQIRAVGGAPNMTFYLATQGWIDIRGKNN